MVAVEREPQHSYTHTESEEIAYRGKFPTFQLIIAIYDLLLFHWLSEKKKKTCVE